MNPAAATAVSAVDPTDLPDDTALLKAMLAEALAALRTSQHEAEQLRQRMDQLLRRLFGRRSERLNPHQLLLFAEPPADEAVTPVTPTNAGEAAKPRRKGHGRQQLPRHLPRDRRVYELSEAERLCHGCGKARVVIGQEVSEQLDYEPASLTVVEHVRLTYACPCCAKQRQAGAPSAPAVTTPPEHCDCTVLGGGLERPRYDDPDPGAAGAVHLPHGLPSAFADRPRPGRAGPAGPPYRQQIL
jgi:transposase